MEDLPLPEAQQSEEAFDEFNANWEAALAESKSTGAPPKLMKVRFRGFCGFWGVVGAAVRGGGVVGGFRAPRIGWGGGWFAGGGGYGRARGGRPRASDVVGAYNGAEI